VMNYGTIFTTVNQGFVNAGNWVSNASGGNVFQNWASDLRAQYNQAGFQQMWGLITGSIAGLIDGLLILVAYLLYPIVIVIFGFFYLFYGSILYLFGPIVIALTPLGGANRLAKSYIENIFVWNAWPILYGGFGALLTAVQMGQVGQMLQHNDFLGGLGNLEGSVLIGIVSIVYSLAIAIIPFIAKRIVSGDVGSTAAAMVGAAVTALTAGAAGFEGAAAGVAAVRAGSGSATSAGAASGAATAGSARALTSGTGGNQPAPPQQIRAASSSAGNGRSLGDGNPTLEGHADQIRSSIGEVMGPSNTEEESGAAITVTAENSSPSPKAASSAGVTPRATSRSSATARRGPSVHRYNVGTWAAYHAARIAAGSVAGVTTRSAERE